MDQRHAASSDFTDTLSTFKQPRETGSSLRWELLSNDSHLGRLMQHETSALGKFER